VGRRRYAELERRPEPERPPVPDAVPEPEGLDPEVADPLLALQRGAGNAATTRLLARQPVVTAPDLRLDPSAIIAQRMTEADILRRTIVPPLLDRLAKPPAAGPTESLAEVTRMARDELATYLRSRPAFPGLPPFMPVQSSVDEIQQAILEVSRGKKLIVPGHRPDGDTAGLQEEARALAALADLKLPDLAIEASAGGLKFRFDGELAASGKVAGAKVDVKGSPEGVEAKAEGGGGKAAVAVGRDGVKIDLGVTAGPVELKGDVSAKAGEATKWSAGLEIKIGGGAGPVPDPAKLADMIRAVDHHLVESARYVGSVVDDPSRISKAEIERTIKPAKESIEKVAGYIKSNQAPPPSRPPGATIGASVSGGDGGVTATVTLTIRF
jgi:hypothetical protein